MGILELIQQKAFLGKEFLTWLWFRAERDGRIDPPDGAPVSVEILGPILLDAHYGEARATALRGDAPAQAPEARTALLEGKKLKKARLKLVREDAEWIVALDGETFNLSGLNVPKPGRLPFEEGLMLRLEFVREFESVLAMLLDLFLELRLDPSAWSAELHEIQAWVEGK